MYFCCLSFSFLNYHTILNYKIIGISNKVAAKREMMQRDHDIIKNHGGTAGEHGVQAGPEVRE